MNNPHVLQQMIQQQMNQMENNMSHMMPGTMPGNAMPSNAMPVSIPNNAMPNNAIPTGNPPMTNQMLNQNATDDTLPSFQQVVCVWDLSPIQTSCEYLSICICGTDRK